MCPQVKTRPRHVDWKAPGLILLLVALATAGAVAGGLLGFAHRPPKVSPSSGHSQGHGQWEGREEASMSQLSSIARARSGWPEDQRGREIRSLPAGWGSVQGCPSLPS